MNWVAAHSNRSHRRGKSPTPPALTTPVRTLRRNLFPLRTALRTECRRMERDLQRIVESTIQMLLECFPRW
jgi:hypothetical protein